MHESTREALRGRSDVDRADIDDIVALAAELQDAERPRGASIEEVQAVAEELDIDPAYVQRAVEELAARREREADVERARDLRRAERMRMFAIVAAACGVLLLLLASTPLALALVAASDLEAARANLAQRESYVEVVLDRQAALVPQLVALSGGDAAALDPLLQRMAGAPDLAARLEAARELDRALASVLARMPAPRDEPQAMQRLGLQHELTGVQNRLTTEIRRLEEARRALDEARSQPGAGLAATLGLAGRG